MRKLVPLIAVLVLALAAVGAFVALSGDPTATPDRPGASGTEAPPAQPGTDGKPSTPTVKRDDLATRRERREEAEAAVQSDDAHALAGRVVGPDGEGLSGATVVVHAAVEGEGDTRFGALRDRFSRLIPRIASSEDDESDDEGEVIVADALSSAESDEAEFDEEDVVSTGMDMGQEMLEDGSLIDLLSGGMDLSAGEFDAKLGERLGATTTDASGAFRVDRLPEGRVRVVASLAGHATRSRAAGVGTLDLRLRLQPGADVRCQVVRDGRVVSGARIRSAELAVETDSSGAALLTGLPKPAARVLVTAPGCVGKGFSITTDPLPDDVVQFALDGAGAVTGRVIRRDGAAVAGATVTTVANSLNPMSFWTLGQSGQGETFPAPAPRAVTDAEGRFTLESVPVGVTALRARASGYLDASAKDVAVRIDATTNAPDLVLAVESVLVGTVTDARGAPLAGARVRVSVPSDADGGMMSMIANAMGGQFRSSRTAEDGTYRVERLVGGERTVKVECDGCLDTEATVTLPDAGETRHDVQMADGLTLAGVVFLPDGRPAVGAEVEVSWPDEGGGNPMSAMMGAFAGGGGASATTDAEGRFRATGLQGGPYSVTASLEGFLDGSLEDVPQDAGTVELTLRAAATVRGRVVAEADGSPVPRARVLYKAPGGGGNGAPWAAMLGNDHDTVFADDQGVFEITGLEAGRVEVYARAQGHAESAHQKFEVAVGAVTDDVVLTLPPAVTLTGRVIDRATGAGVAGALVFVPANNGPFAAMVPSDMNPEMETTAPAESFSTHTADDGSFVVDGLTPGKTTAHVRAKGFAPGSLGVTVPGDAVVIEVSSGGSVEGVVLDAKGRPRAGLQVMIRQGMGVRNFMATTDESGHYRVDHIPPGAYQGMMLDMANGGMPKMEAVRVVDGETTVLDFRPRTEGVQTVRGLVERGGRPLGGATVILMGGASEMRMASSDDQGAFMFDAVPPGSYTVTAQTTMMGGGSQTERITVTEGAPPAEVRIQLSVLSIAGRVVEQSTGKAVAGAHVTVLDPEAGAATSLENLMSAQKGQAFSDAEGNFVVEGVPAGTFRLRVSAAGFPQTHVESVAAGAQGVRVEVKAGQVYRVHVLDPDGGPLAGASVTAEDSSGRETSFFDMALTGVTDGSGEAVLNLAPGRYTLHVQAEGLPKSTVVVTAELSEATVRLARGGSLAVRVVDASGKPLAGARVAVLDAQNREIDRRATFDSLLSSGSSTDAEGRHTRDGLPAGAVVVVVTPPNAAAIRREATIEVGRTTSVEIRLD